MDICIWNHGQLKGGKSSKAAVIRMNLTTPFCGNHFPEFHVAFKNHTTAPRPLFPVWKFSQNTSARWKGVTTGFWKTAYGNVEKMFQHLAFVIFFGLKIGNCTAITESQWYFWFTHSSANNNKPLITCPLKLKFRFRPTKMYGCSQHCTQPLGSFS